MIYNFAIWQHCRYVSLPTVICLTATDYKSHNKRAERKRKSTEIAFNKITKKSNSMKKWQCGHCNLKTAV